MPRFLPCPAALSPCLLRGAGLRVPSFTAHSSYRCREGGCRSKRGFSRLGCLNLMRATLCNDGSAVHGKQPLLQTCTALARVHGLHRSAQLAPQCIVGPLTHPPSCCEAPLYPLPAAHSSTHLFIRHYHNDRWCLQLLRFCRPLRRLPGCWPCKQAAARGRAVGWATGTAPA